MFTEHVLDAAQMHYCKRIIHGKRTWKQIQTSEQVSLSWGRHMDGHRCGASQVAHAANKLSFNSESCSFDLDNVNISKVRLL
jgi:hypothetical protein